MAIERKSIIIIGATSGIAEHCARLWAKDAQADFCLVGRDGGKLDRIAADLRVRSPGATVRVLVGGTEEFIDPAAIVSMVDSIASDGAMDIVLIAHGSLPDQGSCQADLAIANEALQTNGVSPVLFAEGFARHMQAAGRGTLAIIGSVAGDRGRKSNYVYGAAKGLVSRYAQGLQHRLAGSGVAVVLVKPGPTATAMTAHLAQQGAKLAPVEAVAEAIVAGIAKGKPVVYAPGRWALIMMVIRHLPAFVFNRMNI